MDLRTNSGARFGYLVSTQQDRPREPFTVYEAPISVSLRQHIGRFYDGDYSRWDWNIGLRVGARLISQIGWTRDDIELPGGSFTTDLVPIKVSYSFTSRANLQGLIQYNRQSSTISSNIRLALLDRSNTGLFLVYNDRRETSPVTREEVLGRSFIVKFTRLLDL